MKVIVCFAIKKNKIKFAVIHRSNKYHAHSSSEIHLSICFTDISLFVCLLTGMETGPLALSLLVFLVSCGH